MKMYETLRVDNVNQNVHKTTRNVVNGKGIVLKKTSTLKIIFR